MLDDFQKHLNAICPEWKESRFLVAFSGGLDSSALLHLAALTFAPNQLAAAHLNHRIRAEAENDQNFAAEVTEKLNLHFITDQADVPVLAAERKRGLEEAARWARYNFLGQAAELWRADFILTAHQADDQAETIIMRLIKGGGGGGLAGIHPRRPLGRKNPQPELLRPLLPFSRERLENWLQAQGHTWMEDASNNDDHYLRNCLRLEVLPKLKELNPRLLEAMGRCASILRDEENYWTLRLTGLWTKLVDEKSRPGQLLIDRSGLESLTTAEKRRLIYEAFLMIRRQRTGTPEPLTLAGVEMVIAMLAEPAHKGLDLPGGLRAVLSRERLALSLASRFTKT